MKTGRILIGTSGYSYPHWREILYPKGLPQGKWLEHYAGTFPTVELNVTFYRLPSPQMFQQWAARTPGNFRFAVKGWRMVTHRKLLKDCADETRKFLQAASSLGKKLGVVLWQLPPQMEKDLRLLSDFLQIARECSPVRQAVEFRNASWLCSEVYDLLRERGAALCLADMPRAAVADIVTADFVYVRRHGPDGRYRHSYPADRLSELASKAAAWSAQGLDVFIYFNNDYAGHAVHNALEVLRRLGSPSDRRSGPVADE